MKSSSNPELEIQDTGAPRGERNYWMVNLYGVCILGTFNKRQANELFQNLDRALTRGKNAGVNQ